MFSTLSFSSPLILAALIALPGLWMLMRAAPPQPRRAAFPAIRILMGVKADRETPHRTPWPLLALRTLLAALAIIALANPILNAPEAPTSDGPIIVVVDDTYAAASAWQRRATALKIAAEDAASSDRALFIIRTAPSLTPPAIDPLFKDDARQRAASIQPQPFAADHKIAVNALSALDEAIARFDGAPEIRWLSDGLTGDGARAFAKALSSRGALSVLSDNAQSFHALRERAESAPTNDGYGVTVQRASAEAAWRGGVIATARDGRVLARVEAALAAGEKTADVTVPLPLALRNEVAMLRIETVSSAAAVLLSDARDRRALIGVVDDGSVSADALLNGAHYVQKALAGAAAFQRDDLRTLVASNVSVIVLDDVGRLRTGDVEALTAWIEKGGVLIRFAGPTLAEAAQDETPPLLPVPLRGGGRAFGGALSWETPQPLGAFSATGPFASLTPPEDVAIRRQVLARPGGETSDATWAALADGTPIVTGRKIGRGAIALFHVTATPAWSDLPISSIFIDMLQELTYLSFLSPEVAASETTDETRFAALRVLDGFGSLVEAPPTLPGVTLADAAAGPTPDHPPGFYGAPEAPLAVNAVPREQVFKPLELQGIPLTPYSEAAPVRLAPPLLLIALLLFAADAIATLFFAGALSFLKAGTYAQQPGGESRTPETGTSNGEDKGAGNASAGSQSDRMTGKGVTTTAAAIALIGLISAFSFAPSPASAQAPNERPVDAEIDGKTINAALLTRLAYVRTNDPDTDRIVAAGLSSLSDALFRRTAIEPADPVAVNPEVDDLSVYPFIYWAITPGAETPSDAALANLEDFMRFGGLIVFDTRDDERAIGAGSTPERTALRSILTKLDTPPLTPLPESHVLTRSFYLLQDLFGRSGAGPVWVQATGAANDAVTPLIIGGRDWAGAWASDDFGRPLLPSGPGGARRREMALRAGVNIVMVAFTGNYKSDQVHTPILLKRLGR
ncbi:MAG: DUF4159 domain-containing protein [Pseudomonadota bacterium]